MAVESAKALKQLFFDAYGGFSDKRIKNLDKGRLFIVDDRQRKDEDAAGHLFLWFCQIFAEVVDRDAIKITMHGDVPNSPQVAKWFADNGAENSNFGLKFIVKRGEEDRLKNLASAFRAIVRPGARYSVKSYKHVCPRVAASLLRVQHTLSEAWSD